MAKMAAPIVEHGEDVFRKLFRFYKRRNPPPDFSEVVAAELDRNVLSDDAAKRAGLRAVRDWRAYSLQGHPGFIFISNPFLPGSQQHWVKQCLKTYPQKPNVCNLDMHMSPAETENIWEKSIGGFRKKGKQDPKTLLEKLRWVTLGYHYNWDTKTYSPESRSPFPPDLHALSRCLAAVCGFPGFSAEAGILNYYRTDSSLGIHVDESELDHTWPLLSFSFGQTAVFLLGGAKRQDAPTAMFMRSGDVMVMSGPSRLLYHAVPCLVAAPASEPLPSCLGARPTEDAAEDALVRPVSEQDWEVCSRYLLTSRVNMTVRQVLGPGRTFEVATRPGASPHAETRRGYDDDGAEEATSNAKKSRSGSECTLSS
ncbi:nucleic acid dioxygenase ALKBH1 isoform X2 [Brachyhypopomus gauderio]|uniref:nucleic acid dioxygenase ALKBH1 isoform X2 n=1 Tax=Brachyhypopomus gauderio TaxID=698409 RepID=UPI004041FB2C